MPPGSPSPKLAITIAPDVYAQVLAEAARRGVSVSAWTTGAARLAPEVRDGLAAVADLRAHVVTDPRDIARLASAVGAHLDVREI